MQGSRRVPPRQRAPRREHHAHVYNSRRVPSAQDLVEAGSDVAEHGAHIRNARRVPASDVLVKGTITIKHLGQAGRPTARRTAKDAKASQTKYRRHKTGQEPTQQQRAASKKRRHGRPRKRRSFLRGPCNGATRGDRATVRSTLRAERHPECTCALERYHDA
jgi:hypothetical protein